ncbi:MAG: FAD-binding oxidoreductase [Proteobacteria bacterium]|nr:FAD-binding oxidoreductase [Pseudomonadota bacterium]
MPDFVIIGGGIMGSSIAYHLAGSGRAGEVVVIEPDPTYEFAATPRSTGGVRQLFSVPENIWMSQYGHQVYGNFAALMAVNGDAPDINFRHQGYLFMGSGREDVKTLIANWEVQAANGARVELLDRKGLKHRFPSLTVEDIDAAVFSPDDGFIDPYSALMGFRRKAISLGATYLKDRVVGLEAGRKKVERVVLESGRRLDAKVVVNVANCWGPEICAMVGMKVPVYPMRRMTFYYEIRETLEPMALTRHISKGASFRPEGAGYISGLTKYDEPAGFNWEVDYNWFEQRIWPQLAHRVKAFEALKVKRGWSGHYDQNSLDGNVIVGRWIGGLENFYIALGFSGHGLQHGPAMGRAMKELLLDGGYQTIDLSRFSYQRVLDNAPIAEFGPVA